MTTRVNATIGALVAALVAVLLATANRYGFHRDELYFIEAGRHPAWGYVDQPPITPLLGRVSQAVFGSTPAALRVPSVLAAVAIVLLTASIARLLGGTPRARILAAAFTVVAPGLLLLGHLLTTETFDVLAWLVVLWLVVRLLQGADPRLWVAVGVATGIGLLNKDLLLFLLASLAIGIVIGRRTDVLRSKWVVVGAAVALLIWSPNLIWQATHGWPQLDMARSISQSDGASNRGDLLPLQVLLMGPLLFPVWIAGFWWLLRNERARLLRPIAWAYPVLLVATFLGGGKGYYFVPLLFVYLAAGAVVLDRWIHTPTRAVVVGAAVALTAVASAFLALPLLPVRDVGDSVVGDVNPETLETIGWPRFVDQVAAVVASLPPDQRASAVLFAANYGEAGAIDRFGPARGLPRAYSGHNSYSDWGIPPDSAGPVVLTGFSDRRYLDPYWTDCRIAAHVDDGVGVDNDEQGLPIWVCDAPVRPWADMWDDVTHYD